MFLVRAQCRRGPEEMIKRILLLIALGAVVFAIVGCRTVQGIGRDISWIGEKGEQAIQR
jgi:predicted small secreted protein